VTERWSALGNVYLVEERHGPEGHTRGLTPDGVRALCSDDADGVVEVVASEGDEVDVVIWNRDGTTAELSGNGTRIAARWLATRTGAERVVVRTGTRRVTARMLAVDDVETAMGPVEVAPPARIGGVDVVRVRVGNPHAVVQADPGELDRLGPLLVDDPAFPEGTNVEVVRVDARGEVTARVWERGVGETAASGTGAIAAAAATHDAGEVTVHFPGGDLLVRLDDGEATLTGPARREADVER
jgi:diaminopimelate epimerase